MRHGSQSALLSELYFHFQYVVVDGCLIACSRGILVPGGFGQRGTEGKILAVNYARERKIPYLGEGLSVCLSLSLSVCDFEISYLCVQEFV